MAALLARPRTLYCAAQRLLAAAASFSDVLVTPSGFAKLRFPAHNEIGTERSEDRRIPLSAFDSIETFPSKEHKQALIETAQGTMPADDPDVTIREMTAADYEAVTRLWTAAGLHYRPLGRDHPDKIRTELGQATALFLVAEATTGGGASRRGAAGCDIVGVVLGTHDGRRGWVNRLAVAPAYQRRGIAHLLVREVEGRLDALGIDIVAALIESENEASLAFFRAIGYLHAPRIEYVSKRRSADT